MIDRGSLVMPRPVRDAAGNVAAPSTGHPYSALGPDLVVEAVEALGYPSDGRVLALNSYENRVYQVGREEGGPVVVKFYRPGRWTTAAILEEHEFGLELARAEIPVIAPEIHDGRTLFEMGGFRYAVYPRAGGRWPELGTKEDRQWMGRFLARIHGIGRTRTFRHRSRLDWHVLGRETADYLLDSGWIPSHLEAAYESLADDVLDLVAQRFEEASPLPTVSIARRLPPGQRAVDRRRPAFRRPRRLPDRARHPGHLDAAVRPARGNERAAVRHPRRLRRIRRLRHARGVVDRAAAHAAHHALRGLARAPLGRSGVSRAFPWFQEPKYWEEHVLNLREQIAAMEEPPL